MRKSRLYALLLFLTLLLGAGCASIGTPSGGPRDEDPPRFMGANPPQGSVEVTPQRVVLTFNELVQLKDAFSKVVVSPPGSQTPRVSSMGRRVTVEFRDTLLPETTYTVDFGNSIADNNEGNQMDGLIYTFSTGPVLDTLMVSGMVLDALTLAPAQGMYVGLHSNQADSAFTRQRFERVAKTDDEGRFVLAGLPAGAYRIFALEDKDGDLAWSSPEESMAFYSDIIVPSAEEAWANDTLFNLTTGAVDSVWQRRRTRFLPNDILLRSYNTGYRQQYITKYERQDSTRLEFQLNAPADSMPRLEIVETDGSVTPLADVAVVERSATNDTLTFWLRDAAVIARDTLRVAIEYLRADSAYNMVAANDTLRLLTKRTPVKQSKAKEEKRAKGAEAADTLPPPPPLIDLKLLTAKPEVYSSLLIEAPVPLESFDTAMVSLEVREDTLWLPAPDFSARRIRGDSLNPRLLRLDYPWAYGTSYRLQVDSLAGKSIYGLFTDGLTQEFKIRDESEYSSLQFNVLGMGPDTVARYVELLDGSGKPLRSLPVVDGRVLFEYLLAGKYNARVVEDRNGNGVWDAGNFQLGIQPDVAYYYPQQVELKANWSQELDWDVFRTPVDRQLPDDLRKKK